MDWLTLQNNTIYEGINPSHPWRVSFILYKVTRRTVHPKSSEHEKELTTHFASNKWKLRPGKITNKKGCKQVSSPACSGPSCLMSSYARTGLILVQQFSEGSWIANQSTQFPLAPSGICLCHAGNLHSCASQPGLCSFCELHSVHVCISPPPCPL